MNQFTTSIEIKSSPEKAFAAFVEHINAWWPRQTEMHRYSFAPEGTEPKDILFEAKLGGRYYERFADGSEYDIGRITTYEPPNKLAYTWRGPDWPGDSQVEVVFEAAGEQTILSLTHSGFEIFEQPETAKGYEMGSKEILSYFDAWFNQHLEGL